MHEATAAYEATLTVDVIRAFEAFVEDLSNWYIRRSRRRFWEERRGGVQDALVRARAVAARGRAGDAVPHRAPVANLVPGGPASIHLAGWPEAPEPDPARSTRSRACAAWSRWEQARATSGLKLRQPLRRLVVAGAGARRGALGRDRRRAARERVEFGAVEASELRVKPNLPVLGPKLGKELGKVREALAEGSSRSSTAAASA